MTETIPNYFLRRITEEDIEFPFVTSLQKFNRPSKTFKEFYEEDAINGGDFITFIFEREGGLRLGLARYKKFTIKEFIDMIDEFFPPEIKEKIIQEVINKRYLLIYMSRVGIINDFKGIGFGRSLQNFIDAHARITYPNFLLFAKTNIEMFDLIKSRYSIEDFKKRYIYSSVFYSEVMETKFRIILRRILDGRNLGNHALPFYKI